MSKVSRMVVNKGRVNKNVKWTGDDITTKGLTREQLKDRYGIYRVPTPWNIKLDRWQVVWCNNFDGVFDASCGYYIEQLGTRRVWLDFRDVISKYEKGEYINAKAS